LGSCGFLFVRGTRLEKGNNAATTAHNALIIYGSLGDRCPRLWADFPAEHWNVSQRFHVWNQSWCNTADGVWTLRSQLRSFDSRALEDGLEGQFWTYRHWCPRDFKSTKLRPGGCRAAV
jgi:hypothetical protein